MTKGQFLELIGDIDDRFIKELNDAPDDLEDIFSENEQPQIIRYTREPLPLWKAAVSAAVFCICAVGIFAAVKLYGIQLDISTKSNQTISGFINSGTVYENSDYFSFIIAGHNILYPGISSAVQKNGDSSIPANITITGGNLSPENAAYIFVTADKDRPADKIVTKRTKITGLGTYNLEYDGNLFQKNVTSDKMLYLIAVTDIGEVTLEGYWAP